MRSPFHTHHRDREISSLHTRTNCLMHLSFKPIPQPEIFRHTLWQGLAHSEVSLWPRPFRPTQRASPVRPTEEFRFNIQSRVSCESCGGGGADRRGRAESFEAHWTGRAGHEAYGPLPLRCGVSLQMLVHVPGDEKLQFCKKLRPRLRDRQKNSAGTSFAQYLLEGLARELAQSPLHAVRR